jgi:hypothetical protein
METTTEAGLRLFKDAHQSVRDVSERCLSGSRSEDDADLLAVAIAQQLQALNRLEDTPHFDSAHRQLDYAGRVQRVFFPERCRFARTGTSYTQKCPVDIGHVRLGVSVSMIIREAECSICGLDPEDCFHISGRVYDGKDCYRIIKRADLDHVAIVKRPDFPDARLTERPVSTNDLIRALGNNFTPGMEVRCNRCLDRCGGVGSSDLLSEDPTRSALVG